MISYMERFTRIVSKYPDRIAFDDGQNALSYKELDEESGRVYAYLKKNGIGREQFIMILLPRCTSAIAAVIGVLKSGAAFILLEEDYPSARIEYIRNDSGCTLVIDKGKYEEIMASTGEALSGYEKAGLHDAAYIAYTSGSTGNPKGVLHEYGNIDQLVMTNPLEDECEQATRGLMAPFYFIASVVCIINFTVMGMTTYIIAHDLIRDFRRLKQFIYDKRIEGIFLPPSYLRIYKEPSPYLKLISTGSEPANGLFYEGGKPVIRNFYSMTEAGFNILSVDLDRAYDVAPVGYPLLSDIDIHLVDDDGKRVEGQGQGELCFKNEYVRGYLNLPEKNAAAFVNGIFHTGDIARRDADGRYYIVGRVDDMIKINGNRIEPAEIQAKVKAVTGLENVVAKGFVSDDRSYICLYFLKSEADKLDILKDGKLSADMDGLKELLPAYMIPSYYIGIDEFPLNANGKLDKKRLMPPDVQDFRSGYVAPEGEEEKLLCELMEKVLKTGNVGAADDFFVVGGDSIKAIQLIAELADKGYDISETDLFRERTPRKLSSILKQRVSADVEELNKKNESEKLKEHPLLTLQTSIVKRVEENPDNTLVNIPVLYELKSDVDIKRFEEAVNRVFSHHPLLCTKIIQKANGEYIQKYDSTLFKPIQILTMTKEEFTAWMDEAVSPYKLLDSRLYKNGLIVVGEKRYFFEDVHHVLADGTTMQLINDQILESYENPEVSLPEDYYYAILEDIENEKEGATYMEAEEYYRSVFAEQLNIESCSCIIEPDLNGPDIECGAVIKPAAYDKREGEGNIFFMTACALAVANFNNTDRALIYWTHNGRDKYIKSNSAGAYARMLPVYLVTEKGDTPEKLIEKVREQVNFGISHSIYPYVLIHPKPSVNTVQYLYQKDIFTLGKIGALVEKSIPLKKSQKQPIGMFGVSITDNTGADKLIYNCAYSKGYYSGEAIERYGKCFSDAVNYLRREK